MEDKNLNYLSNNGLFTHKNIQSMSLKNPPVKIINKIGKTTKNSAYNDENVWNNDIRLNHFLPQIKGRKPINPFENKY